MISSKNYDIVILGAGVSGLMSGLELFKNNINFVILEASDEILGRVKTNYEFANFPIELGAEYVHGNNNEFYFLSKEFIKNHNYSFIKNEYKELYWVPSLQNLLSYEEIVKLKNADIKKNFKHALKIEKLISNFQQEGDISIKDFKEKYFKNNPFSDIVSTLSSHEKAAGETEIGVYGLQEDDENWGYENDPEYDEFLLKKGNFSEMFSIYFEKILEKVVTNSAVTTINYENEEIELMVKNGMKYTCKKVIITASLGVLKSGCISFIPSLPEEKNEAIEGLGFSGAIKILIKLKNSIWPKGTLFIFPNGEGIVPVYWVTSAGGRSEVDHVLTGFFMGKEAEMFFKKEKELVEKVKLQLSKIFKLSTKDLEDNILKILVKNWLEDPYIQGGYSFIKLGKAFKELRKKLGNNIEKKLFFAGEATSVNFSSTVQGGLLMGLKSAKDAILALKQE